MNHAKLETCYRIFDASIVPVCAGGCARLTEALAARLGRKGTHTAFAELGRPAAPGRIRRARLLLHLLAASLDAPRTESEDANHT